jgi:hypothetical protein
MSRLAEDLTAAVVMSESGHRGRVPPAAIESVAPWSSAELDGRTSEEPSKVVSSGASEVRHSPRHRRAWRQTGHSPRQGIPGNSWRGRANVHVRGGVAPFDQMSLYIANFQGTVDPDWLLTDMGLTRGYAVDSVRTPSVLIGRSETRLGHALRHTRQARQNCAKAASVRVAVTRRRATISLNSGANCCTCSSTWP